MSTLSLTFCNAYDVVVEWNFGFFILCSGMCSHHVLKGFLKFSLYAPRCSQLHHTFIPIHFAQSCLFNYIKWPNEKHPHFSIENSILGSLQSFSFLLWWVNQNDSLQKQKKRKRKRKSKLGKPPHVFDGNKSWIWSEQIVNVLMGGYLHYLSSKFVKEILNLWHP